MAFTHLHVHTEFSLLDGSNKIKEYVSRVKALGQTAAAITDHGVMYGCIDFYKAAKAEGIKPILGCEVYVSPGSRFDRDYSTSDDRYYHLVLLAENNVGYSNLIKIVSAGFTEGFYYRPRVDKEVLRTYHEGIIALSACLAGEVPRHISASDYEGAKRCALEYRDIFGEDNYFLELQDHGIPEQKHVNQLLIRMHEETGIPLVCTNDVHYTYKEDAESHDILLCIQTQKKVTDEDRMRYEGGQYYVKSEEEMSRLFGYIPEAIENTQKIADRCDVNIVFGERKIPEYDVPDGKTSWEYLQELCEEGMQRNYGAAYRTERPELVDRLQYELETIRSMGFVDYFLIVWDYVHYAKNHGIIVGPGRGSAAGSIVSYALGITELDPIRYNLLFERFLNPERVSMPDIDVDFCFERRQEVIDYVVEKYKRDRVVQIVTFGTMAARAVIRDVGRALDLPYSECDRISKMVPRELNITLKKALEMNPDLRKEYQENESVHYLIDMAMRLEGLPRNTSMHAAGVVISGKPVVEYVPLSRAQDGSITTQYTMTTLEELGLLKMDFLGLRTLTVIQNAVRLINEHAEHKLDLSKIDDSDEQVMDMIGRGKCEGVFQLESAGMKSFMKELKPHSMEDIIAGIALYRPGPMDFIPRYIKGKNHPESVTYETPLIEPILNTTYGCIVYQEQVMQIVRDLGGYSMGRSDLVRRAMSKKKESVMAQERKNFIYGNAEEHVPGCLSKHIPEAVANHIFDEMTDFAKYAFNKSHAAAYAIVSYQTAYLKHYYPVEYMAALLTSVIDNPDKCSEYLLYARSVGIRILPPSVNSGEGRFTAENGAIRCGMYSIKSVGRQFIDNIIEERKREPYSSVKDFITRIAGRDGNRRAIENLIKAGALDCFEGTRKQLLMVSPYLLDQAVRERKESMPGQMSIFDMMPAAEKKRYELQLPDVGEFSKEMRLAYEKEVLGIYLSGHPLEEYGDLLAARVTAVSSDFLPDEETGLSRVGGDERVTIGGMITEKTIKYTKNNKVMAFITLEDTVGTVEVLIFPSTYDRCRMLLEEDRKVFIDGRVSAEDDKASKLICERMYPFEEVPRELWIAFDSKETFMNAEQELTGLLDESEGIDEVMVFLRDTRQYRKLAGAGSGRDGILITPETKALFASMYGEQNVTVRVKRPQVPGRAGMR
ncbi:MAG: DNA polymerase III subunit alpha [Lachnospiraceae bacterium]|nr:DNA polymerase III subunit alpha [Lachnospiraceae bacterium]